MPHNEKKPAFNVGAYPQPTFLTEYDRCRRSIYVSGLPLDATQAEVVELFSSVAPIAHVDLVKQDGPQCEYPSIDETKKLAELTRHVDKQRVIAFIEYELPIHQDWAMTKFVSPGSSPHTNQLDSATDILFRVPAPTPCFAAVACASSASR